VSFAQVTTVLLSWQALPTSVHWLELQVQDAAAPPSAPAPMHVWWVPHAAPACHCPFVHVSGVFPEHRAKPAAQVGAASASPPSGVLTSSPLDVSALPLTPLAPVVIIPLEVLALPLVVPELAPLNAAASVPADVLPVPFGAPVMLPTELPEAAPEVVSSGLGEMFPPTHPAIDAAASATTCTAESFIETVLIFSPSLLLLPSAFNGSAT
jgi:hypothetical protein